MTVEILLALIVVAVALAIGSALALAVATYRLRSAAPINKESDATKAARMALLSLAGILVAGLTLVWSYREFIVLKGLY
jgi:hypothetical protein